MSVTIGATLPLSGMFQKFGETGLRVLERAAEEMKAYTAVDLLVEDIAPDAAGAVRRLVARGARVIVGSEVSSDLAQVIPALEGLDVLHLNCLSTAPSLGGQSRKSFRMLADDRYEAAFMAELMAREGIRTIVPLWRGDQFGDQLQAAMATRFRELGGAVAAGVRYAAETSDFRAVTASAAEQLGACWKRAGALPAAVYLVAFEEAAPLFRLAAATASLPLVKWYGSNGTAYSDALAADFEAARYAVRVNFPNPAPGLAEVARVKWQPLVSEGANVFHLMSYDAFRLAVQALMLPGSLRPALVGRSRFYYGTSGACAFNEAGDREAASYDLVSLGETGYQWGGQ